MSRSWFSADWPAPRNVHAVVTTRQQGHSATPFQHNNLALHVGDDEQHVLANRHRLASELSVRQWQWLTQVHGTQVYRVEAEPASAPPQADASITAGAGIALAILTADCLPVLLCDVEGEQVAAVHAGWRGLAAGIVARVVARFAKPPQQLMAYIGPAIGAAHFEVDAPVLAAFQGEAGFPDASLDSRFVATPDKPGHWQADLAGLCRDHLHAMGVSAVYGGSLCSHAREDLFYSFRRDGLTGRMATLIWRD